MRSVLVRLAAVAAGVVIVASCDARVPTATNITPTSAAEAATAAQISVVTAVRSSTRSVASRL
jgi:hypothetical protein